MQITENLREFYHSETIIALCSVSSFNKQDINPTRANKSFAKVDPRIQLVTDLSLLWIQILKHFYFSINFTINSLFSHYHYYPVSR